MTIGFNAPTAVYIVFALISTALISYSLLRYESQNKELVVFGTAILFFLAISLLLSDALWSLVVEGPAAVGLLRSVGAVVWWLSMFGFVLLTGHRLLS